MPFGYQLYFSDRFNNRIFSFSPDTGEHQILVGDTPNKKDSPLRDPYAVTYSEILGLLITDMFNHRICRIVGSNLETFTTFDATGHRDKCRFAKHRNFPWSPAGIFLEKSGSLLVTYSDENTLYRVQQSGRLDLVLGIPPSRPSTIRGCNDNVPEGELEKTVLYTPAGIVSKDDGTMFFIERGWQAVREFHPQRGLRTIFPRDKEGQIEEPPQETTIDEYFPPHPTSLALDGDNTLFLADSRHRCVYEIDLASKNMTRVMISQHDKAKGPAALAVGEDKTVWVIDAGDDHLYGYQKTDGVWGKIDVKFAIPAGANGVCDAIGGMGMIAN